MSYGNLDLNVTMSQKDFTSIIKNLDFLESCDARELASKMRKVYYKALSEAALKINYEEYQNED